MSKPTLPDSHAPQHNSACDLLLVPFSFTALTMDINSLKDTVSNLTLYDLKAGVRKVQNGVSLPWPPDVFSKADA